MKRFHIYFDFGDGREYVYLDRARTMKHIEYAECSLDAVNQYILNHGQELECRNDLSIAYQYLHAVEV